MVVRSPYGEIPWPNLSRLSDEEMKALMIDVVNKTYHALIILFDDRLGGELIKILAQRDFLPRWNEPTLTTTGSVQPADPDLGFQLPGSNSGR